jgi:hypothetical protein
VDNIFNISVPLKKILSDLLVVSGVVVVEDLGKNSASSTTRSIHNK